MFLNEAFTFSKGGTGLKANATRYQLMGKLVVDFSHQRVSFKGQGCLPVCCMVDVLDLILQQRVTTSLRRATAWNLGSGEVPKVIKVGCRELIAKYVAVGKPGTQNWPRRWGP